MRALIVIVALVASLWAGLWFTGSYYLGNAARGWLDNQPGAEYETLEVGGFPSRMDMGLTGLHLRDALSDIQWQTPQVNVYALAYRPWHVIADLSAQQSVVIPGDVLTITSDLLRGSVRVTPNTRLDLNRIQAEGRNLVVQAKYGGRFEVADLDFATQRDAKDDLAHQIGLRITDLALDPAIAAKLANGTTLPGTISLIHLDATAHLSAPLDRFAGETRPELVQIDLRDFSVTWGDMTLLATGQITAGPDGLAEGQIDWTLTNWQAVPPALVALGFIKPEIVATVQRAMALMARANADPAKLKLPKLKLPLKFSEGWMSLGPLPLGPAPRMRAVAGG